MTSQVWRSSSSVPANIAEGYSRGSRKEYIQYLWIAHGSLRELETHLLLSERVGLAKSVEIEPLLTSCGEIGKMLYSLIRKLTSSPRNPESGSRSPK